MARSRLPTRTAPSRAMHGKKVEYLQPSPIHPNQMKKLMAANTLQKTVILSGLISKKNGKRMAVNITVMLTAVCVI